MSDSAQPLPAWLQLSWTKPIQPTCIQLIFDTGLHRVMTLSHADGYTARMLWGCPQPETVSDYTIEAQVKGQWRQIVRVHGNYQRRVVHKIEEGFFNALRINVTATNGLDHVRICEVRVY